MAASLTEARLVMLGLNTRRGGDREKGLLALPGREAEARAAIDEVIAYAVAPLTQALLALMAVIAGGIKALRHSWIIFFMPVQMRANTASRS